MHQLRLIDLNQDDIMLLQGCSEKLEWSYNYHILYFTGQYSSGYYDFHVENGCGD